MATDDLQRLIVSLEARTAAFEKAMNKALGVANQRSRAIESRFAKMNATIGNRLAGIGKGWVAGIVAGIGTRELSQLSDAATKIDNALKIAGLSGAELERVYGSLRDSAVKNAAPLEALVELFSRASLVQKELGVTTEELVGFTDKVALALRVQGKSAEETKGALLQLGQALSTNVVRAEEYNSLQEGAPAILRAVAAGLKEAGGSVGTLTNLVKTGQVTSEAFFRAFEAGAPILEEKVADAQYTISQAMGNLRTALIDTAREFNNSTGAGNTFAEGINNIARAINDVDVSGFISKIKEAGGVLDRFIDNLANAGLIERFAEAVTGLQLTVGKPIDLDTVESEKKLANLDRQIEILQQRIEANKEMAIDTTEAEAALATLLGQAAALRATLAEPSFKTGFEGSPEIPGNQPKRPAPADVKPVSIKDFAAPAGKGKKGKTTPYQRELEQIKERTASLQAETAAQAQLNPLIEDYDYALTKAKATQDLLNAAQKAGIKITPELRANIDTLAEGYANATVEANKLAESQDRAREMADDMRSLGKDVLGGFIKDLQAGKSASEALANALGKVADKLLDIALDSLFGTGSFKGGGALGGLFSFIPKLFGFKDGGIAKNGRPLPRFAGGGVSRSAAIFGEAGPEAAVPLPDGRRIPVDLRVPRVQAAQRDSAPSITINAPINAPGADAAQLRRVEQSVQELGRNIPKIAVGAMKTTQTRNTRPA